MAKKFQFRLEPILKMKTNKVEEANQSLAVALRRRYDKENEIETLQNEKLQKLNSASLPQKAADMQIFRDYINAIDRNIEIKEKEKNKLLEIENVRRERLNEAMQEEKALIKLKEKKYEEYQYEIKKEEANFMDEIAQQQYINKM